MNFFEYQDRARRNTAWLVVLFVLAVVLTILALYAAVILAMELGGMLPYRPGEWWHPGVFLIVALGTLGLIGIGSGTRLVSLRQGGGAVAEALGGTPVRHDTDDPNERRLMNVAEEMAIAAGAPVPSVYLLNHEQGINAFAAGHNMIDAAIGVTRGAVEHLSRDELQGVIAHEFSHIVNNDVRLNIRLIGLLAGLLAISLAGRTLLRSMYWTGAGRRRSRDGDGKGAGAIMLIALAMAVIGAIGMFFARMIKSAVSRQREFLADAAAVQFTRNPSGLAGALKKIGGFPVGAEVRHPRAEELSHMFFSDAFAGSMLSGLFSTHPPLRTRIARIDPSFDPSRFKEEVASYASRPAESAAFAAASPSVPEFPGRAPALDLSINPELVTEKVGSLAFENLAFGRDAIERLDPVLRRSAHETLGAAAIACALLLDEDPEMRARQIEAASRSKIKGLVDEIERIAPQVRQVRRIHRLPLAELLVPALRNMSDAQYRAFLSAVTEMAAADEKLSVFEFALLKVLEHLLADWFEGDARRRGARSFRPADIAEDVAVMLSALAGAGSGNRDEQRRAYEAGLARLKYGSKIRAKFPEPEGSPFDRLGAALDHIASATPTVKKQVLDACAHCVLADRTVTVVEYELLRAIAVSIDCPLPPFVPTAKIA